MGAVGSPRSSRAMSCGNGRSGSALARQRACSSAAETGVTAGGGRSPSVSAATASASVSSSGPAGSLSARRTAYCQRTAGPGSSGPAPSVRRRTRSSSTRATATPRASVTSAPRRSSPAEIRSSSSSSARSGSPIAVHARATATNSGGTRSCAAQRGSCSGRSRAGPASSPTSDIGGTRRARISSSQTEASRSPSMRSIRCCAPLSHASARSSRPSSLLPASPARTPSRRTRSTDRVGREPVEPALFGAVDAVGREPLGALERRERLLVVTGAPQQARGHEPRGRGELGAVDRLLDGLRPGQQRPDRERGRLVRRRQARAVGDRLQRRDPGGDALVERLAARRLASQGRKAARSPLAISPSTRRRPRSRRAAPASRADSRSSESGAMSSTSASTSSHAPGATRPSRCSSAAAWVAPIGARSRRCWGRPASS